MVYLLCQINKLYACFNPSALFQTALSNDAPCSALFTPSAPSSDWSGSIACIDTRAEHILPATVRLWGLKVAV